MSIFKTQWIVLKVKKQSEKEFLYTIFFRDYGKLTVTKRKKGREKSIDIGYNINCEISTKESREIHTIGNIKVIDQFSYENKKFEIIELYLTLIQFLLQNIPAGVPHGEAHKIMEEINKQSSSITPENILLAKLKIKSIFGDIQETCSNTTLQKIIKFINSHSIKDIWKLTGIDRSTFEKLKQL